MSDDTAKTGNGTDEGTTTATLPVVTITSGNPTPDEVAVVSVLLAALSGGGETTGPQQRRRWARPGRQFTGGVAPTMGWGGSF